MNNDAKDNTASRPRPRPRPRPRLRFPEFIDSKGWEEETLDSLCAMQAGKFIQASEIYENPQEGMYPCYGGNGLRGYVSTATHRGTYPLIGRQGALCGNVTLASGSFYATEHALVATPKTNIDTKWLFYTLVDLRLNQYATGQAQPGLSVDVLKKIASFAPPEIQEQKKIADCLSSLDELIEAESQKLEALRRHKKGLMQELFPAEGETVSKRRFPRFGDSWRTSTIGKVARVTTGGKDTQNKKEGGAYPFFVRSQTVERIDTFSYDGEAILTSGDGVGVGKNFHYINGKFDFHQRVYCICDFKRDVFPRYVYLYFSNYFYSRVSQLSAKNSVDSVRMAMITEMPIGLPSYEEQRRIADCLSSADDLIVQQEQKLRNLHGHKRGLIQGLFPTVSEVVHG